MHNSLSYRAGEAPPPADDGEDSPLNDILGVAARRLVAIVAITLVTTLAALVIVMRAHPTFTVGGALYLGNTQPAAGPAPTDAAGLGFLSAYQSVSDVDTQIGLIGAEALIERAVLETGMNATITPQAVAHPSFWVWKLFDHASIDAFRPPPGSLRAISATLADPGLAQASFRLTFGAGGRYSVSTGAGWLAPSRTVLSGTLGAAAAGGGLTLLVEPVYPGDTPPPGSRFTLTVLPARLVAARVADRLSVVAGGTVTQPTSVAAVTLNWWDPYQGVVFVNRLMQDFIDTQLAWKTEAASATEVFIASQLGQMKNSLAAADQKLASYQAETGLLDVPENAKATIDRLAAYETQRTDLQLREQALRQIESQVAGSDGALNPFILSQANDPVLGQLSGEVADAEAKLQMLDVQFTGDSPEVGVQQAQLRALKHAIASLVGNDLALAHANVAADDRMIAQFNGEVAAMPAESLKVVALSRDSDVYGKLYAFLMQKEEEAQVSKAASVIDTRIASPAEAPLTAAKPKAALTIAFGFALGLFASFALVLWQWSFSPRFEGEDEIRRAARAPVYGFIPHGARAAATLLYPGGYRDPAAEGFRLLRGRLVRAAGLRSPGVVAVTSAGTTDGAAFVAANLAKAIAESGQRTVLVDADLQRGPLWSLLDDTGALGLAEWLAASEPPDLQRAAGQAFAVLPAGAPTTGAPALLDETRISDLLTRLRRQFDFVVINAAPLPAAADGLLVASHADLVLSVVAVGETSRREWRAHDELLRSVTRRHGIVIAGAAPAPFRFGGAWRWRWRNFGTPAPAAAE